MPELLLEVGCEELPASFVRKAFNELREKICDGLKEAGIAFGDSTALGTPRRLIVRVEGVEERQPDSVKEMRGPSLSAAYDEAGNPTKALEGFCRGQGVDVGALRKDDQYVWATKTVVGLPTVEVLSAILPKIIRGLTFDKSMRWSNHRLRYARPIRWLLAAFGGAVVPFEIEGVHAGLESRGHRFNHPAPFEAKTFDQLVDGLIARQVEPDPAERETRIREGATINCSGVPQLTDALVDENVFLTEWPTAVEGTFKEEYLELPASVLVTAMAKHERFFPVRDKEGALTNKFVSIRNGGIDAVVREGNAWVLNARFNDAKFFFDEDKKFTLSHFLERTSGIVFQDKLGTVRQRADRLSALAAEIAVQTGAPESEVEFAKQAGLYCKADLSTGLVSELASLQGVIGGEYAKREGFADPVCWAIASQYDPGKNPKIECEGARTAARLMIADAVDKLVGYLGVGLVPSSSSDPFGLRRSVSTLIELAWLWPAVDDLMGPVGTAFRLYQSQGIELNLEGIIVNFQEILAGRYDSLMSEVRHDIRAAALQQEFLARPSRVRFSAAFMAKSSEDSQFVVTATRPLNIVKAAKAKGVKIDSEWPDSSALQSAQGEALMASIRQAEPGAKEAAQKQDVAALLAALKMLEKPINEFFDNTMIMVDDDVVRSARLQLLVKCCELLRLGGDFNSLEG